MEHVTPFPGAFSLAPLCKDCAVFWRLMEIWDGIGFPIASAPCFGGGLGSISAGGKRKAWRFLIAKNETPRDERTHFMTCDAIEMDINHPKGKLQCW